jgi:hypothetical protein
MRIAPKAVRLGENPTLVTLIGVGIGNVRQILKGINQNACLWAFPDVGFLHEQS